MTSFTEDMRSAECSRPAERWSCVRSRPALASAASFTFRRRSRSSSRRAYGLPTRDDGDRDAARPPVARARSQRS